MKVSCRQRSTHWKGPVKWIQNDINFRRSTIFQLPQHIPIQCLGIWQNNKCLPLSFLPVAAKDVKVSKIAWVLQLIMHILSVKKMLEFHSWTCPRGMKLWSQDCAVSWIGPHGPMEGWTTTGHVRFAVSRQVTRPTHKYLPTFFGSESDGKTYHMSFSWVNCPHWVRTCTWSDPGLGIRIPGIPGGPRGQWILKKPWKRRGSECQLTCPEVDHWSNDVKIQWNKHPNTEESELNRSCLPSHHLPSSPINPSERGTRLRQHSWSQHVKLSLEGSKA
jgi:hypothetical protein